jgi:two-component system chemotaxis response regulator CheB
MDALPPDLHAPGEHPTGLSCPDCRGVLTVQAEGNASHLHFQCRVNHTFSLRDLLSSMEERIETELWTAVVSCEELRALVSELHAAQPTAGQESPYEVRAVALQAQIQVLRGTIEAKLPIDIAHIQADGLYTPADEGA